MNNFQSEYTEALRGTWLGLPVPVVSDAYRLSPMCGNNMALTYPQTDLLWQQFKIVLD